LFSIPKAPTNLYDFMLDNRFNATGAGFRTLGYQACARLPRPPVQQIRSLPFSDRRRSAASDALPRSLVLRSGVLLVMATAQPLANADHEDLLYRGDFPDWDYRPVEDDAPFEYKASDWGRLKDARLVALDYSTPAHLTKGDLEELLCAATWRE
jgi:hypothetical protein